MWNEGRGGGSSHFNSTNDSFSLLFYPVGDRGHGSEPDVKVWSSPSPEVDGGRGSDPDIKAPTSPSAELDGGLGTDPDIKVRSSSSLDRRE